jgi:hypothetical protein
MTDLSCKVLILEVEFGKIIYIVVQKTKLIEKIGAGRAMKLN